MKICGVYLVNHYAVQPQIYLTIFFTFAILVSQHDTIEQNNIQTEGYCGMGVLQLPW